MTTQDDDFTAEEIADFEEALKDEKIQKRLERFASWKSRKSSGEEKPTPPSPGASPQPSGSGGKEWTLRDLKDLVGDPDAKSILQHLLGTKAEGSNDVTGKQSNGLTKEVEKKPPPKSDAADPLKPLKRWL